MAVKRFTALSPDISLTFIKVSHFNYKIYFYASLIIIGNAEAVFLVMCDPSMNAL